MENLNTPSFENQLAGRSSGVQVVANSGLWDRSYGKG